ncbi:MAG: hypothetical protein R2809_02110 [Flavobacteriales bacterium]
MNLSLSIAQIKNFLEIQNVTFTMEGPQNNEASYQLASIKSLINNGIYYLVAEYYTTNLKIENSILFTDKYISELSSNLQIIVHNPQLIFYKLCGHFQVEDARGIHPTAILSNVELGENVSIGAYCVLSNCKLGNNTTIHSHVTINRDVVIGESVEIQSNSCIGASGMAWIWDDNGERVIQPQLGGVIIEDHCKLGTDITIVRGSLSENTRIGRGTLMAHGSKVGHGCQIHENVHFANNVSLAGNAIIEESVFLGSGCVVSSNITISKGCIVGAGAVVNKNFNKEYVTLAGVPASIIRENNYESKPKGAPKPIKK